MVMMPYVLMQISTSYNERRKLQMLRIENNKTSYQEQEVGMSVLEAGAL